MKKLMLLASAAMIVASMTSCKKDYTCVCTVTGPGYSESVSATAHLKKSDAKTWCSAGNSSAGGYTETCDLK
jgi:hypothetical protein